MISLLTKLDVIGPEVKFSINRGETFKTPIGGFQSILFVLLSTLAFVAFGRDIFEKKEPTILFSKNA